jgi:hypothetical protein
MAKYKVKLTECDGDGGDVSVEGGDSYDTRDEAYAAGTSAAALAIADKGSAVTSILLVVKSGGTVVLSELRRLHGKRIVLADRDVADDDAPAPPPAFKRRIVPWGSA